RTGAAPVNWRRLMAIPGGAAKRAANPPQAVPVAQAAPEIASGPAALPMLGTVPQVRNRRWRRDVAEARSVFQGQAHLVDVIDKPQSGFAAAIAATRHELAGAAGGEQRRRI